jgi:hypothetical protein
MNRAALVKVSEVAKEMQADCKRDVENLDNTPFTPLGVGETLGTMYAMIATTAKMVEILAGEMLKVTR